MTPQTKPYEIRRGRTEIKVPHGSSSLTFSYPHYGPDRYAQIVEAIEQDGLSPPTMAETVSLVYQAFLDEQRGEPEFPGIRNLMRNRWLYAFTGTLYVPNKGAYIQDRPLVRDGMFFLDESDLLKRLETNDSSVRFVPFGFKTGEMTPAELGKNDYVITLAGREGAEKLAEVASKYTYNPRLWSFESVNSLLTTISGLGAGWEEGHRLLIDGYDSGDYGQCCVFGLQKTNRDNKP